MVPLTKGGRAFAPYSPATLSLAMGGQLQTRWRSPVTLSMRPTGGQYLSSRSARSGKNASAFEYGRDQTPASNR